MKMEERIGKLLGATIEADDLERIVRGLQAVDPVQCAQSVDFGLILSDFSLKAAAEYFRVVPSVLSFISTDELGPWVGMGIPIAEKSAAAGIRFFRQGEEVFSRLPDRNLRESFLKQGITLAREDAHLALEYYRQTPALLAAVRLTPEALAEWVRHGQTLGREDDTLAVEYFRISPELLPVIPLSLLPPWIAVAQQLQPLYRTLLFIRTSPTVFAQAGVCAGKLLDLVTDVARTDATLAEKVFSAASHVLPPFARTGLDEALLTQATQIARFNGEIAATFFLKSAETLHAVGAPHFLQWLEEGMALLKCDPIAAGAYLVMASKTSHEALARLRGGVTLATVAPMLKLFATALSGRSVEVAPASRLADPGAAPTTDGKTIFLPERVHPFPDDARNVEWYKVATAFQTGFLEYGTYTPTLSETADLIASLHAKYRTRGGLSGLTSFFSLFPEPDFIRTLFEIAEGARVEFRLKQAYPGLRAPLIRMREADRHAEPSLIGLTPRGVAVALLRQIAHAGTPRDPIPPEMQATLFEACRMLGAVQSAEATVATSMTAAARVYDLLDDGSAGSMAGGEAFEESGRRERGEGNGAGKTEPSTRGTVDPERVEKTVEKIRAALQEEGLLKKLKEAADSGLMAGVASEAAIRIDTDAGTEGGRSGSSPQKQSETDAGTDRPAQAAEGTAYFYDEWDCHAEAYRPGWCRVVERPVVAVVATEETAADRPVGPVSQIVRAFERLRPEGLHRIRGAEEGDLLDWDRLVEERVAARRGETPSGRVYIDLQKKQRSVAAALLIDVSGSTGRFLPSLDKTVLQVEKEATALLAAALDAIGDPFALYAFSGRRREGVDFHVIKRFEQTGAMRSRIEALRSDGQNRDGAAIRHATRQMRTMPVKTRLLMLISDGRPMDEGYEGGYAIADTKRALREALDAGVHPFCLTVDPAEEATLRAMYGEIAYLVIDRIETLPLQLPKIYKRLTT
jgi:nitric oxide reductase activation protein